MLSRYIIMVNAIDLAAVGPDIVPSNSESLQDAVADKLLIQAETTILANADGITQPADALAALVALRNLPHERRKRIVLHPSFRYWLQALRRTSREEDSAHRIS